MPKCHLKDSVTSSGDGGVEEMVISPQRILEVTTKLPDKTRMKQISSFAFREYDPFPRVRLLTSHRHSEVSATSRSIAGNNSSFSTAVTLISVATTYSKRDPLMETPRFVRIKKSYGPKSSKWVYSLSQYSSIYIYSSGGEGGGADPLQTVLTERFGWCPVRISSGTPDILIQDFVVLPRAYRCTDTNYFATDYFRIFLIIIPLFYTISTYTYIVNVLKFTVNRPNRRVEYL
jgi:hypothetical protein